MCSVNLSQQARLRANQRGVTHQMISDLMAHADVEASVGGGCTVLRVSRERLKDAGVRSGLSSNPDKLASLALVWSDETAEVVTVLLDHGGSRGRRYRRPH